MRIPGLLLLTVRLPHRVKMSGLKRPGCSLGIRPRLWWPKLSVTSHSLSGSTSEQQSWKRTFVPRSGFFGKVNSLGCSPGQVCMGLCRRGGGVAFSTWGVCSWGAGFPLLRLGWWSGWPKTSDTFQAFIWAAWPLPWDCLGGIATWLRCWVQLSFLPFLAMWPRVSWAVALWPRFSPSTR